MAKPIEPTPVLKGDDAFEFVAEMEKQEKAPPFRVMNLLKRKNKKFFHKINLIMYRIKLKVKTSKILTKIKKDKR